MLTLIVSVIASLSILFGSADVAYVDATITTPTQQAQQQQQQQQQQQVQQYDAATLEDVWQTVDDYDITNTTDRELMLSHVRTDVGMGDPTDILTYGQFTLPSLDLPDTFHIYTWSAVHHA